MDPAEPVAGAIVAATDLTEASTAALVRGRELAAAMGAPLVVCHVVPDVFRFHPLIPNPAENELMVETTALTRAADLATEHANEALGSVPGLRVVVESGTPEVEIVRIAESQQAAVIVVGAKPREGVQRVLGHVAERVVRYAHTSVLVAREAEPTGKVLVTTDFSEGSQAALRFAGRLARARGSDVTLLHVVKPPSSALSSALMPLGDTWTPPSRAAVERLEELGRRTLEGLAEQYGFARFEQTEGEPADVVIERAEKLGVEMIVMGSRGRTGLLRLVLGSVAEKVIRNSHCSVLVAREAAGP